MSDRGTALRPEPGTSPLVDPFQEAAGIIDDARSSDRIAVVTLTDLRTDGPWARPLDEAEVKRLADWALHLPAVIVAAWRPVEMPSPSASKP